MSDLHIVLPPHVSAALERLENAGFEAYAVGGCVRDSILGRIPNDWDITTSARPEETQRAFFDKHTLDIGLKHGTVTVMWDGHPLEITTYRFDGVYADNRHPVQVTFSNKPEDDLARRDFTVNAMAYHPKKGLLDLFGGREDLKKQRIACVGNAVTRFREDGLRILRGIRFASVLDFEIEAKTASAIHAERELLRNIAPERIREEFCKLLCGKGAVRILREFADVVSVFLPEISDCVGFAQNSKYHSLDVWEHTLCALAESSPDLVTRLSLLLHDIGKPRVYFEDGEGGHFKGHAAVSVKIAEKFLKFLRFDNATAARIVKLVEIHDIPLLSGEKYVKRLMQRLTDEDILRLLEIQRCDRIAHAPAYNTPSPVLEEIPPVMQKIRESNACLSLKTLAVKGDDLMALGVPKGKEIGLLLNRLLDMVIDGEAENTKESLTDAAARMLGARNQKSIFKNMNKL